MQHKWSVVIVVVVVMWTIKDTERLGRPKCRVVELVEGRWSGGVVGGGGTHLRTGLGGVDGAGQWVVVVVAACGVAGGGQRVVGGRVGGTFTYHELLFSGITSHEGVA